MAIFKEGDNWFIDYRAYGRRLQEKIGPNRKLAETVLAKRQLEIAEKRFIDVRKVATVTFKEFAQRYLEWVRGRLRSIVNEMAYVRRLNQTFGKMQLGEIDLAKVEKFMADRLKEPKQAPFNGKSSQLLSPEDRARRIKAWYENNPPTISKSEVNREVACLRRIMHKALDWKLLSGRPLAGLKFYDERERIRKQYLKPDQIRKVVELCSSPTREVVTFALYTGRRRGEILGMRWQDVDLENGYVFFPDTKKKEPDQVALPPRAVEILARLSKDKKGEYVFYNRNGNRLGDVRTAFQRALRIAEINGFRFHDLRHTAISYMMMNGLDLKTIAELVGHTTSEMVDKRYGHLSPDHKRAAAEVFGSAMDRLSGYHELAGPKRRKQRIAPYLPIVSSSAEQQGNGSAMETFWRLSSSQADETKTGPEKYDGKDDIIPLDAPIAQRIEHPPSERMIEVRFLVGASNFGSKIGS